MSDVDPKDVYDDLDDEEYEERWEKEFDDGLREFFAIKWTADGATTLAEAADMIEGLAIWFREGHEAGWILEQPIDGGHGEIISPELAKIYSK